jgi:hypothetical protein
MHVCFVWRMNHANRYVQTFKPYRSNALEGAGVRGRGGGAGGGRRESPDLFEFKHLKKDIEDLEWLEGVSAKEGGEEEEERDIHMLV